MYFYRFFFFFLIERLNILDVLCLRKYDEKVFEKREIMDIIKGLIFFFSE